MAHLVERLLPTPEIRGSNTVIGKFCLLSTFLNCIENTKTAENGPISKIKLVLEHCAHSSVDLQMALSTIYNGESF